MKQAFVYVLLTCALILGLNDVAFAGPLTFNHSLYDRVLKKFVKDGKVDYQSLQDEPELLEKYLEGLAALSPARLFAAPEDEKLALYINAYNAFILKAVIDRYPVKSINKIPGVWSRLKFDLAGREWTLDEIKDKILMWEFNEPRMHFALVPAAEGSPDLRKGAYRGANLDKMLAGETNQFINDKDKVRLDKDKNILYLSPIFSWFQKDLGDPVKFVSKYLPKEDKDFIRKNKVRIKYIKYDWSLNDKGGTGE